MRHPEHGATIFYPFSAAAMIFTPPHPILLIASLSARGDVDDNNDNNGSGNGGGGGGNGNGGGVSNSYGDGFVTTMARCDAAMPMTTLMPERMMPLSSLSLSLSTTMTTGGMLTTALMSERMTPPSFLSLSLSTTTTGAAAEKEEEEVARKRWRQRGSQCRLLEDDVKGDSNEEEKVMTTG